MAEGGLHDQALAPVVRLRDRGQAVAHRGPHPVVPPAGAVEAAEIGQHPAGEVRVAQHEGRPGAEPDLDQVPMSRQRIEQRQRPAQQRHGVAEERPGAGRPAEPQRAGSRIPGVDRVCPHGDIMPRLGGRTRPRVC